VVLWLKSVRVADIILPLLLSAGIANAETVTGSEFYSDHNGYPCFATLKTDAGERVTLQLSDYKDVWSLNFIVSDQADIYRTFFDSRDLRDEDAFQDAFSSVVIGERTLNFSETTLFEVQRHEVDKKTAGLFGINEQHNVVQALEAMTADGIEIAGLINLNGTAGALSEFRTCSYAAMGLSEGERVETDFRAEYRMIFERAFEDWVSSMSKAEHCLAGRYDDSAVEEVIEAAADAFYPGILNFSKRGSYRDDLEKMLPLAKLSGMADAKKGCLMANKLAEVSRIPVDRSIQEAAGVD
jgi:hypothetical protein